MFESHLLFPVQDQGEEKSGMAGEYTAGFRRDAENLDREGMRREADCGSGVGLSLPGSSLLSWGKLVG
jgi:hypothetical protein